MDPLPSHDVMRVRCLLCRLTTGEEPGLLYSIPRILRTSSMGVAFCSAIVISS